MLVGAGKRDEETKGRRKDRGKGRREWRRKTVNKFDGKGSKAETCSYVLFVATFLTLYL